MEGQILGDAIGVRRIDLFHGAEVSASLGAFGGEQMPFPRTHAHNFAAGGDLEAFRHGFLRFYAFGASHSSNRLLQKSEEYRIRREINQAVF